MSRRRGSPPLRILLLDEDRPQTLYVADGLVRAGCTVRILTSAASERARYTRGRLVQTTVPPIDDPRYIAAVTDVLRTAHSDVVIPMTEAAYRKVWTEEPSWLDRVFPSTEDWQRELLSDKYAFSMHVGAQGVRVPDTFPARSDSDLRAAIDQVGFPVVVKGTTGVSGANVRFATTYEEARAAVRELAQVTGESPFLQRYIDGPTFLAGGLFDGGRPLRYYATHMVQTYPPKTGPSIHHRTTPDSALQAATFDAMRAIAWTGLAEGDFVQDAEGRYYLMEVNPRPWASIGAAAAAGVDLFTPYADLLRGHVPAERLSFRPAVDSVVFPQYHYAQLRLHGVRNPRSWTALLTDPLVWRSVPWRRPGLTVHLARWLGWRMRSRVGEPF